MAHKIKLILGPSCSGKSTYITTYCNDDICTFMASELANNHLPDKDIIVHYNSFNAYKNSSLNLNDKFKDDPVLKYIIESNRDIEVAILISSKSNLIKRASLREHIEPTLREIKHPYPSDKILVLLNSINLFDHYQEIISFFNQLKIKVNLIDTNDGYTSIATNDLALKASLSTKRSDYSLEQVNFITNKFHFEYHSIDLPFNKSTKGTPKDFSTFEKLNFQNKTVLDFGCGYGSLCFFAEKRGAKSVMGTELKPHRHLGGVILKNILSSNVLFSNQNLLTSRLEEQFDIVLLLNVIHHLNEPFYALRELTKITKETFVLEFPTLSDPKFKTTLPADAIVDDNIPLIGVSTKGVDQTFVFNKLAVQRYMEEQVPNFDLEFIPSAINNSREVMIATRKT